MSSPGLKCENKLWRWANWLVRAGKRLEWCWYQAAAVSCRQGTSPLLIHSSGCVAIDVCLEFVALKHFSPFPLVSHGKVHLHQARLGCRTSGSSVPHFQRIPVSHNGQAGRPGQPHSRGRKPQPECCFWPFSTEQNSILYTTAYTRHGKSSTPSVCPPCGHWQMSHLFDWLCFKYLMWLNWRSVQDASPLKQKYLLDFSGLSLNLVWTFYSKLRELWVTTVLLLWRSFTFINSAPFGFVSVIKRRCWRAEFCCYSWCKIVSPCCLTHWSSPSQMREPSQRLLRQRLAAPKRYHDPSLPLGSSTLTSVTVRTAGLPHSREQLEKFMRIDTLGASSTTLRWRTWRLL